MDTASVLELEGTWEEIKTQLPDFKDQRLHVTVRMLDTLPAGVERPVDTALKAIWNQVPDESWKQFPEDFGDNLDHYLYGTPKQK